MAKYSDVLANMGKRIRFNLKGEEYETPVRMPGERIRIIDEGIVSIDRSVFRKTKAEKELLKAIKAQAIIYKR